MLFYACEGFKTEASTEGLVIGFEATLTSTWMVKMQCDLEELLFREYSAVVRFVSPYRKEGAGHDKRTDAMQVPPSFSWFVKQLWSGVWEQG